jgi:hypothetical protein
VSFVHSCNAACNGFAISPEKRFSYSFPSAVSPIATARARHLFKRLRGWLGSGIDPENRRVSTGGTEDTFHRSLVSFGSESRHLRPNASREFPLPELQAHGVLRRLEK